MVVFAVAVCAAEFASGPELRVVPAPDSHPRLWRWAAFDPPLRDPEAGAGAPRQVSCRVCDRHFGRAADPVEALLLAWRHRRHMKG